AGRFFDAYMYQLFIMGFIHGDPHPGNLFIKDDGKICFHDFGLVGYIDITTRRQLI
ncbi:MAG: phosphotransferase, partial [Candidatus Aminicenantes bacterium]|nr:phosphotransferase [Candidatus Aminicenantes bacterium]NIT29413.1 phosphotransferase [Candidatus Aminicenantes bacterium]